MFLVSGCLIMSYHEVFYGRNQLQRSLNISLPAIAGGLIVALLLRQLFQIRG